MPDAIAGDARGAVRGWRDADGSHRQAFRDGDGDDDRPLGSWTQMGARPKSVSSVVSTAWPGLVVGVYPPRSGRGRAVQRPRFKL